MRFFDLVEAEARLAAADGEAKRRANSTTTNRRGRPRNASDPEVAAQDEMIARTVHRLTLWGFNLRRQVLPVVKRLAPQILPTTQRLGRRVLSTDRIEQIFEEFNRQGLGNHNSEFTKAWRVSRRPTGTITYLTTTLLQNSGHWPEDELLLKSGCCFPTPERTPKAQQRMEERLAFFRFRKRTVSRD